MLTRDTGAIFSIFLRSYNDDSDITRVSRQSELNAHYCIFKRNCVFRNTHNLAEYSFLHRNFLYRRKDLRHVNRGTRLRRRWIESLV